MIKVWGWQCPHGYMFRVTVIHVRSTSRFSPSTVTVEVEPDPARPCEWCEPVFLRKSTRTKGER